MKKLVVFIGVVMLTLGACSSDESTPVETPQNVQPIPDNILRFHGSENSYSANYTMQTPDGTVTQGTMHTSTLTYNKIINANLITYLKLNALNDCPMSIHLNQSNLIIEGGVKGGKQYELKFATNENGIKVVTQLIQL